MPPAFRALVDSLHEGVTVHAADGAVLFANATAERLLGVESSALAGGSGGIADWKAFAQNGSDLERALQPVAETLRTGEPQLGTVVGVDVPGGERRWLNVSTRLLEDTDAPDTWAVSASFVDVTARGHAEREMRESEARFRVLAHASPVGTFLLDAKLNPIYINPAMHEVFGGILGDRTSENWIEAVHPDDREGVETAWAKSVAAEEPFLQEYRLVLDSGIRWARVRAAPLPPDDGTAGFAGTVEDVTAKVESFAAAEAEVRLLTAVVSRHERDGTYIYASPAAWRVLGYRPNELVGHSLDEFVPEDDSPRLRAVFEQARDAAGTQTITFPFRDGDNRLRWLESTVRLQRSPDGMTSEIQATTRDVTDRVAAEQERQIAEERFRRSFYDAPIGMALVSPEGRYVQVNRAQCELTGLSEHELLGTPFRSLTHPDDVAELDEALAGVLAGKARTHQMRKRCHHADGHIVWVELAFSLLRTPEGTPHYFVVQEVDVTQRVWAQESERVAEQRLEALLRHTPSAIYLKDLDGRYILVNRATCEILGLPAEEILGSTDEDILPAEVAARLREADRHALEHGPIKRDEVLEVDGRRMVTLTVKFPLLDAEGARYAVGGVSTDITERYESEAAREDLEARLRQAQRMESVGRLASGIAHDFNNLLAVIENYSRFVSVGLPEESSLIDDVEEIRNAASRAGALTHRLLVFSRQGDIAPEVLDLNVIVSDIERLLEGSIGEDANLTTSLQTDPWLLHADRSQIEQVILNLAVNARDAMPGGGALTIQTANVVLSAEEVKPHPGCDPGDFVRLTVTDTGVGMDPDTIERAFEPFFTTKADGSGLGLATTWGIASRAGGFVAIDSAPGAGSTMTVAFPRVRRTAQATTPDEPPHEAPGSGTILLAEDDDAVRRSTARILREAGYEVLEAPQGKPAIAVAGEHEGEIRLLLSDMRMPDMSGAQLARELEAVHPGIPVVYMSGDAAPVTSKESAGEQARVLAKPFSRESLLDAVAEATRGTR